MMRYILALTLIASILGSVGYGLRSYISMKTKSEQLELSLIAANRQIELNRELEKENLKYKAELEQANRKYAELRIAIQEGNNETISAMDGTLGNVLRAIRMFCPNTTETRNDNTCSTSIGDTK